MVVGIPEGKFVFARFLAPHDVDSDGDFNNPTGVITPTWGRLLDRFESEGLIHKIEGHTHEEFLKKRLKEKFGINNPRGIYLIPILANGSNTSRTHWRSFFKTKGMEVFQFKGIGNNAKNFQNRKKFVRDDLGQLATLPIGDYKDAYGKLDKDAFGALTLKLASKQIRMHYAIFSNYDKYHTHKVFEHLNPPEAPPYAIPVGMFKPLERVAQLTGVVKGNRYTRVPVKNPTHVYDTDDVILLTHALVGPIRLEEIAHNLIPRKTANEHIKKLANYYKIPNFNLKSQEDLLLLAGKMVQRIILVRSQLRMAGFAMHHKRGKRVANIFGSKDFNGAIFYDTDGLSKFKNDELSNKLDFKTLRELIWSVGESLKLRPENVLAIRNYANELMNQTNDAIKKEHALLKTQEQPKT